MSGAPPPGSGSPSPHRDPARTEDPPPGSRPGLLLALGLLQSGLLAALAWWPGLPLPFPGFALFAGAFAVYVLAARAVGEGGGRTRMVIWTVAVAARAVLVPVEPELSDDVYRYLWDGHVQASGVNPYLHAPADPALDSLAIPVRERVNNPGVPTIYPPVVQLAFRAGALLGGGILTLKLLWLAFDLLAGAALAGAARRRGRDAHRPLLLYLWSPLLLVEVAWNGHLETLGLAGIAALLAWGHRPFLAGVAAGWATLVKFAPAAALPPLVRERGAAFLAGFVVPGLLYLPYLGAGERLWAGLSTYAGTWRFNETAFVLVEALVPGPRGPRIAVALVVAAVVAWATLRRWDGERSLRVILATGLILSPTLHPWYTLWILPLAALGSHAAWIALTGTAFVGYHGLPTFLDSGQWPQPVWGRVILWGPVVALLLAGRPGIRRAVGRWTGRGRTPDP